MITSWELIMAAHTSWHSIKAASGEKQKQGEERCQPFPLLTDERTTASQRLVCNLVEQYLIAIRFIFLPLYPN